MESRPFSERKAGWAFAVGGLVFVLFVAAMAVAHFVFGQTISDEAGNPLPPRDLLLFFAIAPTLGVIVSARGFWMLTHPKTGTN